MASSLCSCILSRTDGRRIPTVFVPEGEPLLTLLLTNYEHLASHNYQHRVEYDPAE